MTFSIIHSTQGICNYILEKEEKKVEKKVGIFTISAVIKVI